SSVPRVLTALHVAQATGALTLTRDGVKKLVLFERGRPVFAVSNVPAERFGARAVRDGLVSAERLGALVDETGGKIPVAEALVARGLLDADRRASIVRDQICEILWNAFPWRGGSYRLLVSPLTRRPPVAVDIFPGDLVLEGLRRTATLETLRAALPPALALAPGPDPAFELYDLDISAAEATLLAHADGTKSVADLALLTPLDERSALAFLQGCREIGLLVEVGRVLAGTRRIGFM
ncbi:MAG TPA: DUF4388 domain-containing protein, partial [Anaeromyxobacteraceae bacterium]|nr:DUF4388 domain-containing protein [Anaeromyxobacteraceae bacterium]